MPPSAALLVGLALLYAGAELTVRGARSLGLRAGLSPVLVGLTFVAFGTSAPELVVSLRGALQGHDGLALGNVVGSNICNILLILGLCSLVRPMEVHAQLLRVDVPLLVGVSTLTAGLLLLLGGLGRLGGACLLGGLAVYTISSVRRARLESEAVVAEVRAAQPEPGSRAWLDVAFALLGLGLLVGGGAAFVDGAAALAARLGVPANIIGLTVVAVGTSLPELASSLLAAVRAQGDIALGNVVGSNLFNLLGILGIVALIQPVGMGGVQLRDLVVMLAAALLLFAFLYSRRRLERWEGAVLLVGYGLYLASLVP